MAKKLICLLLIIPIIAMISLFTATKSMGIMVDVPVSGITFAEADSHIYLNLDKEETYAIDYTVYPITAKNKSVIASSEKIDGKNEATFDFETEDGRVTLKPKSPGSAKIYLTTAEGGFRQSVTVHVKSSAISAMSSSIVQNGTPVDKIAVDETASIITTFEPKDPPDRTLTYSSSNENVVTVDSNGQIKALRRGHAEITVTSNFNPDFKQTLSISVYNDYTLSLSGQNKVMSENGNLSIDSSLEDFDIAKLKVLAYRLENGIKTPIDDSVIKLLINGSVGDQNLSVDYSFVDKYETGTFVIEILYEDELNPVTTSFTLNKSFDFNVLFMSTGSVITETMINIPDSGFISLEFAVDPSDIKLSTSNISLTSSNPDVINNCGSYKRPNSDAIGLRFVPTKSGVSVLTLSVTYEGVTETADLTVYVSPGDAFSISTPKISFEEKYTGENNGANFDPHRFSRSPIEDLITIAKYEYSGGNLVLTQENEEHCIRLDFLYEKVEFGSDPSFINNLTWELFALDENGNAHKTEDVYIKAVNGSGILSFKDPTDSFNGMVELRLTFGSNAEGSDNKITTSFRLRCVSNAINVYSYNDLLLATTVNKGKDIVLRNHISRDFGYYVNEHGQTVPYYTEIHTTYDDQYYKNLCKTQEEYENSTKIKILMEFSSAVYGNGHTVNAHNIACGVDTAGVTNTSALFYPGPLNFVAVKDDAAGSGDAISVKGQDNICFALYDGAVLNNVQLQGSSLTPDIETGEVDLTHLTYSGTVVEVLGENATIEYSRITNGRTVVRAFGAKDNPDIPINLNVKNSLLSGAREFIIRAGSNRFTENGIYTGRLDDTRYAPMITPENTDGYAPEDIIDANSAHNTKNNYNNLSSNQREYYDDNYINTFVTLENCSLKSTGLFAIGIDSHFASNSLASGKDFASGYQVLQIGNGKTMLDTWENLSKTSYGAKVKFVGRVDLCTWQPISLINSNSIIESNIGENASANYSFINEMLDFDIREILENNISHDFPAILDGEYVHGGIIFFGGGKNYGVFDFTEASATIKNGIKKYDITFQNLGDQSFLNLAAGNEPFVFFMFDKTSEFNYSKQKEQTDSFLSPKK